jgi:DNA-directed RNA polymerase specialized sigma24 family protein
MGYFSQIVVEVEEMYMQGFSKTRIAEILNLPYDTVESYLSNFEETSDD